MSTPQWYTVYNVATGVAVSRGTVVASPLPGGLAAVASTAPLGTPEHWDVASLTWVADPLPPRRISKYDMRRRFTDTEIVALTLARRGYAPDGVTTITPLQAAQIEAISDDLATAGDVDLTDPSTIAGIGYAIDYLAAVGAVADGVTRKAAMLASAGSYPREQQP